MEQHVRQRVIPTLGVPATVNEPLDDEPALILSGRTVLLRRYRVPEDPCVVVDEGPLIREAFVRMPGLTAQDLMGRNANWEKVLALPRAEAQARLVESIWDLISWNEESLIEDSTQLKGKPRPKLGGPFYFINEDEVWLGDEVNLRPGCVVDASRGPVLIDDHVSVGANSVIEGPCHIGRYSVIKPLTHVRPGTSIGMMCKIGGEVSNSIFLGYSNKSHDGFVGDSYVGKWVNLGAGTTTSNMKNTHGEINFRMGSKEIPTGRRFLGAIIGDHAKTSIVTRLQSGAYIGFCSLLAGSSVAPKFVPSFTFWSDDKVETYRLEKAIDVIRGVFARRDRPWTEMDERIMHYVKEAAAAIER
jgi:UDP-N-acetylglucosamine diphosphorylase/glucosamine-1-phosphate N-acetyltransferase